MKNKKLRFTLVALLCAFVFAFAGCSTNKPVEVADTEIIEAKDELVLALGLVDNGQFDPKKGWGTHGQIRLTHSSLLKRDADLNILGDLATTYEISEDGLQWMFSLRDDVKFSNGEAVTIEDVVFTYEMLKEDGIKFDLSFVDNIEVQDKKTIIFNLTEPRSTFVGQLTEIGIVPKDIYDDNYSNNPIGSGPYVVAQYDEGQQLILEENPHYYGTKPQFKKLTFLLLSEDTALAAARAGEVDIAYVPTAFADQKIEGMVLRAFESIDVRGLVLPTVKSGAKGLTSGNEVEVGNDVTSDIAIRRALAVGLNRQNLIDIVLKGHGQKAYSLCDKMPWFNSDTVVEDGNIEEAKKILADAGWIDTDNDGILEKDGLKAEFDLYHSASDQLRTDIALVVADMAKELGIKINTVGTTWDEIFLKGKTNAVVWGGGRHHAHQLYTMYSSNAIDTGINNMPNYQNPKVDEYLQKAMNASSQEEANKYWKLAQWDGETGFSLLGDAPIVWLLRFDHTYLANEKLDLGKQPIVSHGQEWSILGNITEWNWKN
ncbi:ABC-type dipeptide transport system, periplasmic component [Clostridium aceticum]|uniref:ABC-type dipeptide transport system, periplasmic component n=1 Tax=Clostridium aceticum TaxID=84022 RepID=A0A0D8IDK8_9CLOT|nr:ABC transporter substrate-binding protein [Clostridium aceticum]AKL96555.1 ABC-type dipeptide transport system, periplasmic component [Clostridium aceticum]KJF27286.1 nickel ABC transporter substrate-binding protein [Clostridium aceticum]